MKAFNDYISEESFPVNKGHAYEFVLAAAIIARFTDRYDDGSPMPVTERSVEQVMSNFFQVRTVWTTSAGDGVADTIEFDGSGLPRDVMAAMRDVTLRKGATVKKMVRDAILAVKKNRTLTKLSTKVITNHKEDEVRIVCGGTTGQMDTKSDVDVYVNGPLRKAGFSVKYAGTKQAGQFAGVDPAKNLEDAFDSFGMNVSRLGAMRGIRKIMSQLHPPYDSRTDPIITKDKEIAFAAVHPLFVQIGKKFGRNYMSQKNNARKVLKGLLKANIGKEDDVELIRTSVSFDKRTFDKISDFVMEAAKNDQVEWRTIAGKTNPTIAFYAGGYELFSVRFRYDADRKKHGYMPRFRVLVENGKYLDILAASV